MPDQILFTAWSFSPSSRALHRLSCPAIAGARSVVLALVLGMAAPALLVGCGAGEVSSQSRDRISTKGEPERSGQGPSAFFGLPFHPDKNPRREVSSDNAVILATSAGEVWVARDRHRTCLTDAQTRSSTCSTAVEARRTGLALGVFNADAGATRPRIFRLMGVAPRFRCAALVDVGGTKRRIGVRSGVFGIKARRPIRLVTFSGHCARR